MHATNVQIYILLYDLPFIGPPIRITALIMATSTAEVTLRLITIFTLNPFGKVAMEISSLLQTCWPRNFHGLSSLMTISLGLHVVLTETAWHLSPLQRGVKNTRQIEHGILGTTYSILPTCNPEGRHLQRVSRI